MTRAARNGALALGFDEAGVGRVLSIVTRGMFYKSMTAHASPADWQDVYHVPAVSPVKGAVMLYVKFTRMADGHWVLSFKEK